MLSCYEHCVWLDLDMPCPFGTVAGQKFEPEPSQNQGCLKPPAQHIMKTTAGPFHFLYMSPMSDVIML
jgi:hypothetical protein